MSNRIFSFLSEYIRQNPVKISFATIPPLVLIIGNIQKELGILPNKNSLYCATKKLSKDDNLILYSFQK